MIAVYAPLIKLNRYDKLGEIKPETEKVLASFCSKRKRKRKKKRETARTCSKTDLIGSNANV